jgi:energy-coupling factor transport system substrate-specific component
MSWQVATYAMLAVVLVGGFAWYERARPSSRMLGLVAALAALAAAGRVALTPIPNVTPTTDIALLSGYALGGAPGFVVGALAALVSNFWLGQGPWTPWQMAGWGLAGVAGAALARATGRRIGRIGLAIACGVAGLAYGALLDLSLMVTYGGEQSLERYLALSARGVPFNVAHAVGNAAFALAAGPAIVAILTRFRSRLEFSWRPAPAAVGASLALLLLPAAALAAAGEERGETPGSPAELRASGSAGARGYLERAQNRDGGLPSTPGRSSSVAITGWAMLGLEASGRNPLDLRKRGRSPISFLRANGSAIRSTGDLERTILALEGAGVNPRSFAGRDLVSELASRRSDGGSFQGQVNLTAFGILALRASGVPRSSLRSPAEWLRRAQNRDGGWGFRPDSPSDPDSSGAAIQGLAAAGNRGRAVSRGASYLRRSQRSDGGWALALGGPTNSQSTAWAVQGLVAAGRGPGAAPRDPLRYLAARQASDGHYRYSAASDQTPVWVTGQALLAVEREAFPLARVPRAREPGGVPLPASRTRSGARGADAKGGAAEERRAGSGSGDGRRRGSRRAAAAAPAREEAASQANGAAGATAYAPTAEDGGLGTGHYVGGGFVLLCLGLVAGFALYRRRLP